MRIIECFIPVRLTIHDSEWNIIQLMKWLLKRSVIQNACTQFLLFNYEHYKKNFITSRNELLKSKISFIRTHVTGVGVVMRKGRGGRGRGLILILGKIHYKNQC